MVSKLDVLSRSLIASRYFTKGWGNPGYLRSLFEWRQVISDRDKCFKLVSPDYPITIDKDEQQANCRIIEGHFLSPFAEIIPGIMPEEVEVARFQAVFPKKWKGPQKPVVIHLAGTGDHFFWRRRTLLARPLIKEAGIGSIILENPYYGLRKPKKQIRSNLHNVSDLFVMGGALMLESLALLHWCEREGLGPLGLTGISMGGHMASLAATTWPKPIALVPCLSWSTASTAFTTGVMSASIPWKVLQEQYRSDTAYEQEFLKRIHSPEHDHKNTSFMAGQEFARSYPASLHDMQTHWDVGGNNNKGVVREMGNLDNSIHMDKTNNGDTPGSSIDTMKKHRTNSHPEGSTDATKKRCTNEHPKGSTDATKQRCTNDHPEGSTDTTKNRKPPSHTGTNNTTNENTAWRLDRVKRLKRRLVELTVSHTKHEDTAFNFMAGVMDEFTHLGNFSVPFDPSLIIIVVAKSDAYIPRESVISLKELWPEAQVRVLDAGHITAFLFKQSAFRQAIIDSMKMLGDKYYS